MKIKSQKDFFSGLMFSAVGAAFALGATTYTCLLYTSDAADERSSVDLGGRRIIKKNKHILHKTKA